jgi:hypothetical protein
VKGYSNTWDTETCLNICIYIHILAHFQNPTWSVTPCWQENPNTVICNTVICNVIFRIQTREYIFKCWLILENKKTECLTTLKITDSARTRTLTLNLKTSDGWLYIQEGEGELPNPNPNPKSKTGKIRIWPPSRRESATLKTDAHTDNPKCGKQTLNAANPKRGKQTLHATNPKCSKPSKS